MNKKLKSKEDDKTNVDVTHVDVKTTLEKKNFTA